MRTGVALTVLVVASLTALNCGPTDRGSAMGFLTDIARAPPDCGDGRAIVAIAVGSDRVKLNVEGPMELRTAVTRLRQVLRYRAEKLVFITAEANVAFGEFASLLDAVWPEVQIVSIVTPRIAAEASRTHCLAPSCGSCSDMLRGRSGSALRR
jgi:hypothetical protein